jgi:DNA-binding protein HU-beta
MKQPLPPVAATGLPILNPTLYLHNRLRNKSVYVIISPNPDYVLADLYIGFASLASGAIGMIKTTSDLFLVLRTLSLIKNSKNVIDNLKGVIPRSSMMVRPNERREVYNAYLSDPLMWTKPTGIINLFGGKGFTMLVIDEDFQNAVMFNTQLNKEYYVNETGVGNPMHFWNSGHMRTGLKSSAPPSLIQMNNEMLLIYRDYSGRRIYIARYEEGKFTNKGRGWIRQDSNQSIGVSGMRGNLLMVARDPTGDQMFSLWEANQEIPFDAGIRWMGPDIKGKPSATTIGGTTYMVAKHKGNAVMWAILNEHGGTEYGNTGMNTEHSPSIHAYKGKLYVVFSRMDTRQMVIASSTDGKKWTEIRNDLPKTSSGPALTIYKDKLYIIYRDGSGNGVFYMWTEDGIHFKQPRDHYFGFDVASEPTASPLPGDNSGIMIAGILPTEWNIMDPFNFPTAEEMIWTILVPEGTGPDKGPGPFRKKSANTAKAAADPVKSTKPISKKTKATPAKKKTAAKSSIEPVKANLRSGAKKATVTASPAKPAKKTKAASGKNKAVPGRKKAVAKKVTSLTPELNVTATVKKAIKQTKAAARKTIVKAAPGKKKSGAKNATPKKAKAKAVPVSRKIAAKRTLSTKAKAGTTAKKVVKKAAAKTNATKKAKATAAPVKKKMTAMQVKKAPAKKASAKMKE